jgi:hypothetical protein
MFGENDARTVRSASFKNVIDESVEWKKFTANS